MLLLTTDSRFEAYFMFFTVHDGYKRFLSRTPYPNSVYSIIAFAVAAPSSHSFEFRHTLIRYGM